MKKIEFTSEQINHICYQIGEWYLIWKNNITDSKTHRLGYAKEMLKIMICGQGGEDEDD